MLPELEFSLYGEREIRTQLDALAKALGDLGPLLEDIGSELESSVNVRFDTKLDPLGVRWAPLAQATKDRYAQIDRKKGTSGNPPLIRSGLMRGSLGYEVSGDSVVVGFGRPYAIWHELGTTRMPRRGLLTGDAGELGPADREAILGLINDYIARSF